MLPNRVIDQYGVIHVLDASGFNYFPENPEPKIAHPRLMLAFLLISGWLAFVGVGFCVWRAAEALAG